MSSDCCDLHTLYNILESFSAIGIILVLLTTLSLLVLPGIDAY